MLTNLQLNCFVNACVRFSALKFKSANSSSIDFIYTGVLKMYPISISFPVESFPQESLCFAFFGSFLLCRCAEYGLARLRKH